MSRDGYYHTIELETNSVVVKRHAFMTDTNKGITSRPRKVWGSSFNFVS
jgi:hypothetical protein